VRVGRTRYAVCGVGQIRAAGVKDFGKNHLACRKKENGAHVKLAMMPRTEEHCVEGRAWEAVVEVKIKTREEIRGG